MILCDGRHNTCHLSMLVCAGAEVRFDAKNRRLPGAYRRWGAFRSRCPQPSLGKAPHEPMAGDSGRAPGPLRGSVAGGRRALPTAISCTPTDDVRLRRANLWSSTSSPELDVRSAWHTDRHPQERSAGRTKTNAAALQPAAAVCGVRSSGGQQAYNEGTCLANATPDNAMYGGPDHGIL